MIAPPSAPAPSSDARPPSAWAPLRLAVFRNLWIAALASNVGTWMHEVGAGWLMKHLTAGPGGESDRLMVALVQAATTLPMFLLSIPAGALADILDRRRLMLVCQGVALILAGVLALASWQGAAGPWLLLVVTLGLGASAALTNPAWQTAMTDLVPRDQLPAAAGLNSISLNLSRAIGPTIGGFLVATAGPAAAFALNALSFVGIVVALWSWEHRCARHAALAERFFGALRAGVRYVRFSPPMHAVLVRTASFVIFASALWALMPILAGEHLGMTATGYGLMLGGLGVGAVSAGLFIPRLRARVGPGSLVALATVAYAASMTLIALVPRPPVAIAAMVLAGASWLTMVTSLNVAAQSNAPAWVRARALACYLSAFFGSMAIGSVVWGAVATHLGLDRTLLVAAAGLVLGLATMLRWRLTVAPGEDLSLSRAWEDPVVAHEVSPDDGPVVVTIEYRVRAADSDAFRDAMEPVSLTRYRDGAISWLLTRDTENPEQWLEVFVVESWAEHLRQHARVTAADERIQRAAKRFHVGPPDRPLVRHYIAAAAPGRRQTLAPPPPAEHRD